MEQGKEEEAGLREQGRGSVEVRDVENRGGGAGQKQGQG